MKRLIYRYLYGTYYWLDNRLWSGPNTYASIRSISDDLVIVFGLTKKQTKWYLKSWCKRNPKFDFNKAWKDVIKLNVKSVEVLGETRTLRASWTPELAFELECLHNMDVEAELTALL